jgi:hypothetical protein
LTRTDQQMPEVPRAYLPGADNQCGKAAKIESKDEV